MKLAVLFLALTLSLVAAAETPEERTILDVLKGRNVVLRQAHGGERLRFHRDGNAIKPERPLWSWDAMLAVTTVKIKKDKVVIEGERIALIVREADGKMIPARTGSNRTVEIARDPAQPFTPDSAALWKVFLKPEEKLVEAVPDHWLSCSVGGLVKDVRGSSPVWRCRTCGELTKVSLPPGPATERLNRACDLPDEGLASIKPAAAGKQPDVVPPKLLRNEPPVYPRELRRRQISGFTTLSCVVNKDGTPTNIQVFIPGGAGFDDAAVEAVRQWRWKPAMRGSEPVAVQIQVRVNFALRKW